jgi:uncharacterized protein involved in exopolysaccharide biosynthesis
MDWVQIEGREIPLLEPPETQKETPRRVLQVLFRYKRLIRKTFLIISIPALLILLLMPTRYIAVSKVFIKPSRAFLQLNPLNPTYSDNRAGVLASPDMLNSEIEIIKSRELAEQLYQQVPFPDDSFLAKAGPVDAKPVRASSIIEIKLTSTNPGWAVQAVNRLAELYQEQHVKVHKTQGVERFYEDQEKKLQSELLTAEAALKAFQEKEKIIDAPEEVMADLKALASFESNLKQTDSLIRETEQRVAVLDDQLKQQNATISSNKNITMNPVYTQMQTKLTQLQLEKDSLLQRYTPDDRLVKDKEKEIDELKRQLATVKQTAVGSEDISINEVHRRILNELLGARVQLRALNEKKTALTRQVEDYSSTAAEKKRKGYEYDRLLRDVNARKENLDLYRRKAEEARISDAMDEQKFSNVFILEKASLPLSPPRNPWLLAAMIIVASLGVSIGIAFAFNYFDPTLQDEAYVEDKIGLPVLATIQYYGDLRPVRQMAAD